jgi:glycosyltransferase involved in cell wall biosynthesis
MTKNKIRIAFVGIAGFPYRIGAAYSRLLLLTKGLTENNCYVLVINRRGYDLDKHVPVTGHIDKVIFTHSSGISIRPEGLLRRNLYKIKGAINEIYLLKSKKVQVVIINITRNWLLILNYWIWSKIFRYKLLLSYVELNSQLEGRKVNLFKRINDILFEKYVFRILDGIFPISEFLKDIALKSNPRLPYLKIPTIADFSKFNIEKNVNEPYFIFCGQSKYLYIIEFIIKAYELIKDDTVKLKLIIHDKTWHFKKVISLVNCSPRKEQIEILSDLAYDDLVKYYINAIGLLIPLKPSLKDEARFPHKIGEYTAAANPIITTNVGEIKNYFTDLHDALIADKFEPECYADKMYYVIKNPDKARIIGTNGSLTGLRYFDYRKNCNMMKKFIESII